MFIILIYNFIPIFEREGIKFIFDNTWRAPEDNPEEEWYGIASALWGTIYTATLATVLTLPLSLSTAIFLCEFAPRKIREILVIALDMMATLPTVVYGVWGMTILAPIVRDYVIIPVIETLGWLPIFSEYSLSGQCVFTAALVLAIMNIPYATAILREAYMMIPYVYREGIISLGATRTEAIRILTGMIKHAVIAAIALSFGKAVGETTAVTLTVGNSFKISLSPFVAGYTITSLLVNQFGNAYTYKYASYALYGAALVMLIISTVCILTGLALASRWARTYGFRT